MGDSEQEELLRIVSEENMSDIRESMGMALPPSGVQSRIQDDILEERLEIMEKMILDLREELYELKDSMEKSVDGMDKVQTISQTAIVAAIQPKGINTPGGMSTEQLQEFKKQTLQINGLQQKMKDLESKLTEAAASIKKGNERSAEMEEKSIENVKDLYSTIDQINNSLSEKIALQRVEMQKLAGDTPKAINYDPFNYGEAYGGDFVDFQARKRITKIKLLLHSLQAAMNTLRDSVKVSPEVDLGYKVVRLDQLLAATGFREAIATGESSHDEAVVITQQASREPGRVEMPRKEMFQTTEDLESKWAITDSIMQTMYRLEMELGDMQKCIGSTEQASNSKVIDDLAASVKQLKEKQMDVKMIKRLIEDSTSGVPPPKTRQPSVDFTRQPMASTTSREEWVTRSLHEESLRPLKSLQHTVENLVQRFMNLEVFNEPRPSTAFTKSRQGQQRVAYLACDRTIDVKKMNQSSTTTKLAPLSSLYDSSRSLASQAFIKYPTRLKYTINRTFTIDTSTGIMDVYSIPRPCGAGYSVYWPIQRNVSKEPATEPARSSDMKIQYIQGQDGHYYMGSDVPVLRSERERKAPVTIVRARAFSRHTVSARPAGTKILREIKHSSKKSVALKSINDSVGNRGSVVTSVVAPSSVVKTENTEPSVVEMRDIVEESKQSEEDALSNPVEVVEDVIEDEVEPLQEEFDNTTFFNEDESQNARPDVAFWPVLPDNNNNAHGRCADCLPPNLTITNIIELVSAANTSPPEMVSFSRSSSRLVTSQSPAQVAAWTDVNCLAPQNWTAHQRRKPTAGLCILWGSELKFIRA